VRSLALVLLLLLGGCSGTTKAGGPDLPAGTGTHAPTKSAQPVYDCGRAGPTANRARRLGEQCLESAIQVGQPAFFVDVSRRLGVRVVTRYDVAGQGDLTITVTQNGLSQVRQCVGAASLRVLGSCSREAR
jgi:hypothetical protein